MKPKTTEPGFVNCVICGLRKCLLQIICQLLNLWGLGKCLVFKLWCSYTYAPALLMNIQSNVNVLTCKVYFANFLHGESPFGFIFVFAN